MKPGRSQHLETVRLQENIRKVDQKKPEAVEGLVTNETGSDSAVIHDSCDDQGCPNDFLQLKRVNLNVNFIRAVDFWGERFSATPKQIDVEQGSIE